MTGLKKIRVVFIVLLAVFAAADVALVGYLLWGGVSNGSERRAEEQKLREELTAKTSQSSPLDGMDQKLIKSREDVRHLYDARVPAYWSDIAAELYKLENANGVSSESIRYKPEGTGLPNLQRVEIDTGVSSDYLKIAHFINDLERDRFLFVIDQVSVVGQPTGIVQLQIKLETFLKGAA